MKKLLAAAVLLAALTAFAVAAAAADTASETSEPIAFTRDKAVYVMGTDGTGVRLLWQGKRRVLDVAWSPDGRKLAVGTGALRGTRGGGIWVMNADGSNPVRVAGVPATSLTWSPDGRKIASTSRGDIWVMDADGSSIRVLRRTPRLGEGNVDWSPDGRRLLFASGGGYGLPSIYTMSANGSNIRRLTAKPGREPEWSPDGRRIAFTSVPWEGPAEIAVMTANGRNVRTLTEGSNPVWSPDGRKIVFLRGRSAEVYAMNADGSDVTRLTHNRVTEGSPAWQPAALIAFTREDGVYVVGADGTGLRRLWQGRWPGEVTWSPDGRKLAFSTSGRSVWVMNADGSDRVRVARVEARSLSWSPDGRRIAFTRRYKSDDPDIWVMDANGSHVRRLARTPNVWDSNVDWKPTGGWLAFDSGSWVPFVYVMRTNGKNLRELPPPPTLRGWPDSTNPDWSPDGRRIVFASVVGSDSFEIWVMNASGKQWVQLTKNRVHDSSPVWSPDGRRIAFLRGNPDPDSWEIYVMNADGSGARNLTKGASPAWQPLAHRAPQATNRS